MKGFLFERSYFNAIENLPIQDRAKVYGAICDYALNGTVRELEGQSAAILALIKPSIDHRGREAARKRKERA